MRDYAFSKLSLHKLTAGCYVTNPASIRAFKKVGFAEEGLLRSQYLTEYGRYTDEVVLGCLADEVYTGKSTTTLPEWYYGTYYPSTSGEVKVS